MNPRSGLGAAPGIPRRSLRALAWKAVVSIALLAGVLYFVPLRQIGATLSGVEILPIVASVVAVLVLHGIGSVQIRAIIERQHIGLTIPAIFRINLVTSFYTLFLPGTLAGGAIRWYYFSREPGKGPPALAAIAFNRIVETVTLVMVGLVCFAVDRAGGGTAALAGILAGSAALTLLVYLLCLQPGFHSRVASLSGVRHLPAALRGRTERFVAALAAYSHCSLRFHATILVLSLLRHGAGIVGILILADAMGLGLGFVTVAWFRAAVTLLLMLPVSLGGFGIREVSFVALLQPLGVSPAAAIGFSLLLLARNAVVGLVGGAIELERVVRNRPAAAAHGG